jgi:hypothetical protein
VEGIGVSDAMYASAALEPPAGGANNTNPRTPPYPLLTPVAHRGHPFGEQARYVAVGLSLDAITRAGEISQPRQSNKAKQSM